MRASGKSEIAASAKGCPLYKRDEIIRSVAVSLVWSPEPLPKIRMLKLEDFPNSRKSWLFPFQLTKLDSLNKK